VGICIDLALKHRTEPGKKTLPKVTPYHFIARCHVPLPLLNQANPLTLTRQLTFYQYVFRHTKIPRAETSAHF
jgi:hypothetical protein